MANKIEGSIVSLSETGGLVTNITASQLNEVPRDESVSITIGGHQTVGIYPEDHGQPDSTLIAILPETEPLRVELVGISISEMLGLGVGESVTVAW
ncbi:MAG: adenosylmethionine-8-amino-7-oxononanoate aminotransferase [Planctomycetota bacterium]|nr:adenosylmethionine-8-amino-7-oxononanoate aminotransferase [Planctomycetota bacterium]